MSIFLVAGLGNPGREYASTRHNLGFLVVDSLAQARGLSWKYQAAFDAEIARWDRKAGQTVYLLKPQTYMNESGRAVGAAARFFKVPSQSIVAVYDDLTIDLGLAKLSVSGSAGGHNGVASLIEHLGDGWLRYRLGIGPKLPKEMDLKDFVLGQFLEEQQQRVSQRIEPTLNGLELLLDQGVERAMNQINRRDTQ